MWWGIRSSASFVLPLRCVCLVLGAVGSRLLVFFVTFSPEVLSHRAELHLALFCRNAEEPQKVVCVQKLSFQSIGISEIYFGEAQNESIFGES